MGHRKLLNLTNCYRRSGGGGGGRGEGMLTGLVIPFRGEVIICVAVLKTEKIIHV